MGLILNTNVASLIAQRNLSHNTTSVQSSYEKLSSGLRINRAADDAAGLSISETLKTQIRGSQKAIANAQDGVNTLQIAEGALGVITENLQRIRELAIQAANDTNATTERRAITQEVLARVKDIQRIALSTRGNNIRLLDGSNSHYRLQVGANTSAETNVLDLSAALQGATIGVLSLASTNLTATGANGILANNSNSRTFIGDIDAALSIINDRRSRLGALQNALGSTIESLTIAVENLQSTDSRIRNLDIASESANMTKNQILQQSALSILSQANQAPTLVLKLLQ